MYVSVHYEAPNNSFKQKCQSNLAFDFYRALTNTIFAYLSDVIVSSKILQNQIFEKRQNETGCIFKKLVLYFE